MYKMSILFSIFLSLFAFFHIAHNPGYIKMYNFCHILSFLNTINRTINRAIEAIELAKINPTVENLSKARMWTNLVKESLKKDELQKEINKKIEK